MTALFESLLLMLICDVFSLLIPTFLHFSQVGKPILDSIIKLPTAVKDLCYSRNIAEHLPD